jgi:DNA-binding transcriptional LysR family regulator
MLKNLEDVKIFVRIAERGSLSAAGRELRMSVAVVSHRIARLEKDLGTTLFWRTTRKLQLTDEGRRFLEHSRELLDVVQRAEAELSEEHTPTPGPITVTVPVTLGREFIAPLIPTFQEDHAGISVQLHLSDRLMNLIDDQYDLAIRIANLPDSALVARKLADNQRVICASPTYLEKNGLPQTLEDLNTHNCLLLRFPGSKQYQWTIESETVPKKLNLTGTMDADQMEVLRQWALDHQGITMQDHRDVADELANGRLVPVLENVTPASYAIYALYPKRLYMPPRTRAFFDFLVHQFKAM